MTANLRDPRLGKIWRAGAMPVTLSIALPAIGGVSIFGLFNTNFDAVGSVTLRLGTTAGAGDLWEIVIAAGSISGRKSVNVLRDVNGDLATVAAAHATIIVTDGDPLEIGRIWLGMADWQSEVAHTLDGSGWGGQDLSQRSRTPRSGAFLIDRGARLRTFTANYAALRRDEYAGSLFEMDDRGTAQQMLFIPVPDVYDTNKFSVLGNLTEIPNTSWRNFLTAGRSITIEEAG